jgi:hypothetical protein
MKLIKYASLLGLVWILVGCGRDSAEGVRGA